MTDLPIHRTITDIPVLDTAMGDMRGRAPPVLEETDNTRKFVGIAAIAAMIAAAGIVSYSMGMWNSAPAKAPATFAEANTVSTSPAVIVPQQAVVAPVAPVQASPIVAPVVITRTPVVAHIPARHSTTPRNSTVDRAPLVQAPQETVAPVVIAPVQPAAVPPAELAPTAPIQPMQMTPAQPALPATDQPAPSTTAQPPQ